MAKIEGNLRAFSAPAQKVGAVVVAAGDSRRMNGIDKIFAPLNSKPLVYHSVQALHEVQQVNAITLVLSKTNLQKGHDLIGQHNWHKVRDVCAGGDRRQDSVLNGLKSLSDCDWIIVQDGARPFIDERMVLDGLTEACQTGAAIAGVPAKDTIKIVGQDMSVTATLPRDKLWVIQTPQIFNREMLLKAHEHILDDVTDDASMIERIGIKTRIFMGAYENIKITTPEDLRVAEAIIESRTALAGEKQ